MWQRQVLDWQSLRGAGSLAFTANKDRQSARRVLVDGLLLNILNPKLSIFFVAFLPQFIQSDEIAPLMRMFELSGVFMLMTFVVFAIDGFFAAAMRTMVLERSGVVRRMQQRFAAAFGAMVVRLAAQER